MAEPFLNHLGWQAQATIGNAIDAAPFSDPGEPISLLATPPDCSTSADDAHSPQCVVTPTLEHFAAKWNHLASQKCG
jgi:hypothetical protein